MGGIELNDGAIAGVVAALGSTVRPVTRDRSRIERQMREIALEHVGRGISNETRLGRMKQLWASLAEIEESAQVGAPADRAVEWLRVLGETWQHADVPQARSELLHAIYERIVIAGKEFVSARLTPATYANGLALTLLDTVWRARQDSNLRPSAPEADALSAELQARDATAARPRSGGNDTPVSRGARGSVAARIPTGVFRIGGCGLRGRSTPIRQRRPG